MKKASGKYEHSWYGGGLSAGIDALKAARRDLERGCQVSGSVRRVARILRVSGIHQGMANLTQLALGVERAGDEHLAAALDRLVFELERFGWALSAAEPSVVLVVEEDPQMARLLTGVLAGPDRRVLQARSAREARDLLAQGPVALIIMDLALPDGDGRDFLMELRERAVTASLPIMVLSGLPGVQPKTECLALGVDAYFEKPIAPEVLKAAVTSRLQRVLKERREIRQDGLTGLPNRAACAEYFHRLAAHACRRQEPLTLAFMDLDRFQVVNRQLGHVRGDQILRRAAEVMRKGLRRSDVLARWGGDEFVLLLPGTDIEGAKVAAGKIQGMLLEEGVHMEDGARVSLSFSAGLAEVDPARPALERALEEADRLLYRAKSSGRGRILAATESPPPFRSPVLLATQETGTAAMVRGCLEREGFHLVECRDAAKAMEALRGGRYSLAVLDMDLPLGPGRCFQDTFAAWDRAMGLKTPVLMLVPAGNELALVFEPQVHARDYLVKPFSPFELLARAHKLLRKRA